MQVSTYFQHSSGTYIHQIMGRPDFKHLASHLIVTKNKSALINCHDDDMRSCLRKLHLPSPGVLLATHIDKPISKQGSAFGTVPCHVPARQLLIAQDPAKFLQEAKTTWQDPENWATTMGRERWGVGGSRKYDPPTVAIEKAVPITAGEKIQLSETISLEAFSLSFHGPDSLGYSLLENNRPTALFIGEALRAPGTMARLFEAETQYGAIDWRMLTDMYTYLAEGQHCDLFFNSFGELIPDGRAAADRVIDKMSELKKAWAFKPDGFTKQEQQLEDPSANIHKRAEGVYQMKKWQNTIVLINDSGAGLVVDPGPCDFHNPERFKNFNNDFDWLEKHAGLKHVDTILITHFHGDHIDMAPELQRRYAGAKVCAWEPVARVIQNPERYGYGCLLPWYNVGQERTQVDHAITKKNPLVWHGVRVQPVYTPGHCKAHAAYILNFAGHKIAITGDTIQSNGELPGAQWIPCNESVVGYDSDITIAYENMVGKEITLNLGGHGSWFTNCEESYRAGLERARVFSAAARALFHPQDLIDAQRPRWFAELDICDS